MDSKKQKIGAALMLTMLVVVCKSVDAKLLENGWEYGHATFYGDMEGNETMEGACGYGDLHKEGYGLETTALSTALFNGGLTCGACYQIMCHESEWCLNSTEPKTIHVTATNFCPPNYTKPNENWCNPPLKHFDLTQLMFTTIAVYRAGIVPVAYRRVSCNKRGGIKFEMKGNPSWPAVLVYNVGGAGDVQMVKVKCSNTDWMEMQRSWGQIWVMDPSLFGRGLSFQVITSDGRMVQSDDVVPPNCQFGQTFEGKQFAHY